MIMTGTKYCSKQKQIEKMYIIIESNLKKSGKH